jgi:hypothetical protein
MIMRRSDVMNRLVLSAFALLSGLALANGAEAAAYQHGYGKLTPAEHAAVVRSQRQLDALKARTWADGRVTPWERAKIKVAEQRHNALVYRLRHN